MSGIGGLRPVMECPVALRGMTNLLIHPRRATISDSEAVVTLRGMGDLIIHPKRAVVSDMETAVNIKIAETTSMAIDMNDALAMVQAPVMIVRDTIDMSVALAMVQALMERILRADTVNIAAADLARARIR
ncbi:hypothetical protein N7495_007209 [Penicillium taxi]|uniref:uncharacterized protein n=1 Tax=Penicillium taxi TaxID=168475 RepID=UPI0025459A61|nr:uncharacterized protein N7495_007209 [Penicillium taxi]KAJ5895518.1 hypothetical protein N7495_007209 [Penicillium taxi]